MDLNKKISSKEISKGLIKITLKTNRRIEYINITNEIQRVIKSMIKEYMENKEENLEESNNAFKKEINYKALLIYTPHTSAGIFINEGYDPNVIQDIESVLNKNFSGINFKHSEGNSDAHFKSSFFGNSIVIPIYNQELLLGKWQSIFFGEFDGPREREVFLRLL